MPNGEPQLTGVAIKNAAIARAPTVGQRKFLFRLSTDVLPQHSNGPTAVSNSTSNATGIMTRLKKGGPTVILCPWTQSERLGKSVPQSKAKTRHSRRDPNPNSRPNPARNKPNAPRGRCHTSKAPRSPSSNGG